MDAADKEREAQARALARMQRWIAGVLGALAIASILACITGAWPMAAVDEASIAWFGRTSMRLRFTGAFVAYGLVILAGLLIALAIKGVVQRARRR